MIQSRPREHNPFQFIPATDSALKNVLLSALRAPLSKVLGLETLGSMYARAHAPAAASVNADPLVRAGEFVSRALAELRVGSEVAAADLARVPRTGALMVMANHPFGVVEGLVLARHLLAIRPDVKILANHLLSAIPEMRPLLIELDAFGGRGARGRNMAGLRAALAWLKKGGAVVAFPAGEVASLKLGRRMVADPPWRPGMARLARKAAAPVLPVFFHGRNGALFQAAGLVHPRLRTLLIPRENLGRSGHCLRLSMGAAIGPDKLAAFATDEEASSYLRFRCHLLRGRGGPQAEPGAAPKMEQSALAAQRPRERRLAELAALPPERILVRGAPFLVFEAMAHEIPAMMHEVARLREGTFRSVGEGTGRPLDADGYDAHYRHLILWNEADGEVAGAYRFAGTDEILAEHGPSGLYTASQFRIRPDFWRRVDPALELGRSFVRVRYQKSYQPLLLLWKGLAEYVSRNPRYRRLFGCVSISGEYSQLARELMMRFLRRHSFDAGLARLVKPTRPPREGRLARLDVCLPDSAFRDPGDLHDLVAELEGGRGVPVLLRQYLKLGGRIAAFNVDPGFGGCLDALICVDLAMTEERTLARFMGAENARSFLTRHTAARLASPHAA